MEDANFRGKLRICELLQVQQDTLVAVVETVSPRETHPCKCPKVRELKQIVSVVT
jgi:hypothetical protein